MSLTIKVGGRDITPYLRTQHDAGLDPAGSEYQEPQFAGSPAFREGQEWAGDAVANRTFEAPLFLSANSEDALHQLIRDINSELAPGAEVEYRGRGASASSHFRLERGRLDVQYEFWVTAHNRVRAMLHLWVEPFAGTGTSRTVASFGPRADKAHQFPATGILGDTDAVANLEVRVGSRVASNGRLIGYGVHRSASFNAFLGDGQTRFEPQASSVMNVSSTAWHIPVSPTTASGVAIRAYLTPPGGHIGRHRVFGIFQSRLDRPITMWARDRFGAPLGPTTAASQTDSTKWALTDLGEINVPHRASGQEPVPTQVIEVIAGGASGAAITASPAFRTQGLVLIPLDHSPGLFRTRGAGGDSLLYADGFGRFDSELNLMLKNLPQAESGNAVWTLVRGGLGMFTDSGGITPEIQQAMTARAAIGGWFPNASGLYSLASGTLHSDVLAEVKTGLSHNASPAAASAVTQLWAKSFTNASIVTQGVAARLQLGPSQTLQLIVASGGGTAVIASAGIASTLASGLYTGQKHRLVLRTNGNLADVWLATGALGASPILSATSPIIEAPGWPALQMNHGSHVASAAILADDFSYSKVGGSAPDAAARAWFRFESHPEPRVYQGNASVFEFDRAADFRGQHPKLPAVGSPGASGPCRVVVFSGDPDDFVTGDVLDINITGRERHRFLR